MRVQGLGFRVQGLGICVAEMYTGIAVSGGSDSMLCDSQNEALINWVVAYVGF